MSNHHHRHHARGKKPHRRGKSPSEMILPHVGDEGRQRIAKFLHEAEFIVFDIETTGGNPERNGITEIFAIRYCNGEILGTFYSLVNPGISIPPIVRRMTGITNQMVRSAPPINEVMPKFLEFIGQDVMVSHNTIGDMKFIRYFAKQCVGVDMENFYLCTHLLVERLVSEAPDKSLRGLAKHFNFNSGNLHRAEADAYVTLDLFKELVSRLGKAEVSRIEDAIRLQSDLESALRLGWGVKPEVLNNLPRGPGVFYLHDHAGKVMFVSSSFDVAQDVAKMKEATLLPKQLMRLALRSYHVSATKAKSRFGAMLAEGPSLNGHNVLAKPQAWHRREVQAFCIRRVEGAIEVSISTVGPGTIYAFGPLRDHRLAGIFLADIAKIFSVAVKKGNILELPPEAEDYILSLLKGQLAELQRDVEGQRKSLGLWFKPAERKRLKAKSLLLAGLSDLKLPFKIEPLHEICGFITLPVAGAETEVHTIIGLDPVNLTHVKTLQDETNPELEDIFKVGREKAAEFRREGAFIPMSEEVAFRANAVLWWIYNVRGEGKFKHV